MPIEIKREELSAQTAFTKITDSKFKTDTIKIKFITKLRRDDAPKNTMAAILMGSTNKNYKTYSEMTDKLNSLYGAVLSSDVTRVGDCQVITLTAGTISSRFSFNGEDILESLLDILTDCIFSPNADNEKFDDIEFELKRRDLIETIEAEINNKRGYAIQKAQEYIFEGEPCACSQYGTVEEVEKITSHDAYKAYKNIINNSRIEIYYVSAQENEKVRNRFKKAFSKINGKPETLDFITPSPLKKQLCKKSDTVDVLQAKVVMAYKSESKDTDGCRIMCQMLGGTTFSKLFTNVREKLSLCYFCGSVFIISKNTIIIDSGVEDENIEKLIAECDKQLISLAQGDFTQEELANTKLAVKNSIKSVADTPSSLISWYFNGWCFGNMRTPEQCIEDMNNVTRERVISAAKSFGQDTVYVMTNDNKKEEAGEENCEQ
ncbi:MAG: pitrilysin family protein [Oscillospiraceae bacterium]|nr:pitrilysin family protein [Oscillospiraceae bacterium]